MTVVAGAYSNVDDGDVGSKECSTCGVDKPYSEFYADPRGEGGVLTECKKCILAKRKANYQKKKNQQVSDEGLNRVQRFERGFIKPSELSDEEVINSYIRNDDGTIVPNDQIAQRFQAKFSKELSRRITQYIRTKTPRAVEIIFDIADSDLVEPADRLKAATWIAERIIGKTPDVLLTSQVEAPHETIFENIVTTSRDSHRKELEPGGIIDADVIELEQDSDDGPFSGGTGGLTDFGRSGSGEAEDSPDLESQEGDDNSAEENAQQIVDKRERAKDLKKRIQEQKKRRFAGRAVGAKSLESQPWMIDWRVNQDGLRACLVPPSAQTPAKLAIIQANDAATNDAQFINQQRINALKKRAELLQAKSEKLKGITNG